MHPVRRQKMTNHVRSLVRKATKRISQIFFASLYWAGPWSRKFRPVDGALARIGYLGIKGYRKYLSPIKGYRCAHARVSGGPSCSAAALAAFHAHPFSEAIAETQLQFDRCRDAGCRVNADIFDQAQQHLPSMATDLLPLMACTPCTPDP